VSSPHISLVGSHSEAVTVTASSAGLAMSQGIMLSYFFNFLALQQSEAETKINCVERIDGARPLCGLLFLSPLAKSPLGRVPHEGDRSAGHHRCHCAAR
jgi:hypothetical protein